VARIIPVVDVMGGRVVRAVGGRRSEYRPLESRLTDSTDPVVVARRLLDVTGAGELYVADLDVITGRGTSTPFDLALDGTKVWIDRGVRTYDDLERWPEQPGMVPVIGSETILDPAALARSMFVQKRCGVVSVDLKDGQVVGGYGGEVSYEAASFIDTFASVGCCRAVILLDLSAVGEGNGPVPVVYYLLDQLRHEWPDLEFVVGGGVRNRGDVQSLLNAGADAVLVASALHDGALP
jgi:phosphoribosylformimino-5-aminoimidazole carboxamide ribotide isomerase